MIDLTFAGTADADHAFLAQELTCLAQELTHTLIFDAHPYFPRSCVYEQDRDLHLQ